MRKTLVVLVAVFFLVGGQFQTRAQTNASDSAVPASQSADTDINKATQNFIEKLASSVAQTRKNDNHVVVGDITDIKDQEFTVLANAGDTYTVAFIEGNLTKIYQIVNGQKKELKQSDLKKGNFVIVSGVISDKSVTANVVYVDQPYMVESGSITEISNTDYYIKVTTPEKDNFTVDVETYTKINAVNIKTLALERIGFSKLKEGDIIHFVYQPSLSAKEKNRVSARRILMIPQEYFIK
ncbi:hypothetical protein M1523_01070 [Patescibacteria group bacterium]|nr:hypothetical protein [Patescibacteria group bacterium]MCL5091748.1 hypothetical protein [Patescibacteria group bacterium]